MVDRPTCIQRLHAMYVVDISWQVFQLDIIAAFLRWWTVRIHTEKVIGLGKKVYTILDESIKPLAKCLNDNMWWWWVLV